MSTARTEQISNDQGRVTAGLVLGPLLGLAFLLLSLLRIYGDMGSGLFGGEAAIAAIEHPILEMKLGFRLITFGCALVLIHIMLGVAAWLMALISKRAWPNSTSSQRAWTFLWLVAAVIWILAANAAWFPASSLGSPYFAFVQQSIQGISLFEAISVAAAAAAGLTILRFIWKQRRALRPTRPAALAAAGIVLVSGSMAVVRDPGMSWRSAAAPAIQPNIILVGLDSLRTDTISGDASQSLAPNVRAYFLESTTFTDTVTPLARTFSAWVSILTGRNPHTTGASLNLIPRDLVDTGATLPDVLRAAGYEAVYGIDDVRFSNIDESYGFDRTVSPRIGSADFLIEFFGDTPLSNLIVNTRFGDALFPELHGNRAAEVTYDPDSFLRDLDHSLYFSSPTFLAVHLTLAHWPYTWSRSSVRPASSVTGDDIPALYDAAVRRLDRQFADLMNMLERKGALENAIVVVLSDHGESLGESSSLADADGDISPLLGKREIFGHGTHVFSREQYRVLFGVRTYGDTPLIAPAGARIAYPASLEDIAPTLLDALELEENDPFDGRSLMPFLGNSQNASAAGGSERIRFVETEFNPSGIAVEERMTGSAISRAAATYRIDPETDRVEVRRERLAGILNSRQYGAILGDHMLASVPAADASRQHLVYTGADGPGPVWLDAPPRATDPPEVRTLWSALSNRFEAVGNRPVVDWPSPAD